MQVLTNAFPFIHFAYGPLTAEPGVQRAILEKLDSPRFLRLWSIVAPHTLLDLFRAKRIFDEVEQNLDREGDLVECGVAAGGVALMIALILHERDSDKRLFLFDSFEGLPRPDRSVDRMYSESEFHNEVTAVSALLERHGVRDRCEIRKGWFSDTLPQLAPEQRFCFAHVDADLYRSTVDCLMSLHPRMSDGAPMVFDDYYDGSNGVMLAVNELVDRTGEIVEIGPTCQALLRRGKGPGDSTDSTTVVVDRRGTPGETGLRVHLSTSGLASNEAYREFMARVVDHYEKRMGLLHAYLSLTQSGSSAEPAEPK